MSEILPDHEVAAIVSAYRELDPEGTLTARVLRDTIDQLYDGQRTGRYRWSQLYKTEKTHCGTLVEINLQRKFDFGNGEVLDYKIAGIEVDCKFSQDWCRWTIPPEAFDQVCIVAWADDSVSPTWSLGVVRMRKCWLNIGKNRDSKVSLKSEHRNQIHWLWDRAPLPPNILVQMGDRIVDKIMSSHFGTQRTNELFRQALGIIVSRNIVATVDRGDDYMKRVRGNGGARTSLKPEGIVILGQYSLHTAIAVALGLPVPGPGDSISVRLVPADPGPGVVEISGSFWRIADPNDPKVCAPDLPKIPKSP
ncbi:MAG: NaeI family type II restriction endonuclease [Verrucomicrobiota bacterium]